MDLKISVSQTILTQLGGNRFIAMTGAKNFVATSRSLMLSLPRSFAKSGINKALVILRNDDLYNIEFLSVRGVLVNVISSAEGLYGDGLQASFTAHTGLETSL